MSDYEEFNIPDGLIETSELFEATGVIANHIAAYAEFVDNDDFDKQFISNFYFVINEVVKDYDDIGKDKVMDYLCDISIGFLFMSSFVLKCFSHADRDGYNRMVEIIHDKVIPLINNAETVFPYWNEEEWG